MKEKIKRASQGNENSTRNKTILQEPYRYLGCPYCKILRTIFEWTREELKRMDRRIRKVMTMHKTVHRRDDEDRLCVKKRRKKTCQYWRQRWRASIQWLEDYIEKHGGRLITATRNNTDNMRINRIEITKKQKWEEKQLYGRFKLLTSDISHEKMWTWLKKEILRKKLNLF